MLGGLINEYSANNIQMSSPKITKKNKIIASFYTNVEYGDVIKIDNYYYEYVGNNKYKFTKLGLNKVGKEYTPDMLTIDGSKKTQFI